MADFEPITDLDSWHSEDSGPLLTISGKTVAFAAVTSHKKDNELWNEAGELSKVPRILVKWFRKRQPQECAEGNEVYVLHRTCIFNQETYRRTANQNLDGTYGQKKKEEKTTSHQPILIDHRYPAWVRS